jgi:hypothetical protein
MKTKGPSAGNPFVNVELSAVFSDGYKAYMRGFYNGNGNYFILFMPRTTGRWSYVTESTLIHELFKPNLKIDTDEKLIDPCFYCIYPGNSIL